MELSNKILSDLTVYMKYARFVPELNRRETWEEMVQRNMDMHIKKYPQLGDGWIPKTEEQRKKEALPKRYTGR